MSAEIISFKADKTLVGHIEAILEKAKRGEIDSIMYATTYPDGKIGSGHCIAPDKGFNAVAAVCRLLRTIEDFAFDG